VIPRPIPIVCLVVLLLCAAAPVRAQGVAGGEREAEAIRAVISSQIEAFARDDGEVAFAFAAPVIRQMLGDTANFVTVTEAD